MSASSPAAGDAPHSADTPTVTFVLPSDEIYSPRDGGAVTTVTYELVRALDGIGIAGTVLTPRLRSDPWDAGSVEELTFSFRQSPWRRALNRAARSLGRPGATSAARYRQAVAEHVSGGVVVVHNDPQLAVLLASRADKVVLWLHNLLVGPPAALLPELPATIEVVAISSYVQRWTVDRTGIDAGRITVIHNGVDAQRFALPAQRDQDGPLRVVCHARIDPNKGQVLAAQAVARAQRLGADVSLTIVGGVKTFGMPQDVVDAYERALELAVADAGATRIGHVPFPEIPALLRTADVALALSTVPEPFSLAALEAMASGCALVVVPLGGLSEVVADAAVRVEPDAEDVARALVDLARDSDFRHDLQQRGRRRALELSWTTAATRLAALIGTPPDPEGGHP